MQNASMIALSRMMAQQRAVDVTATNLANASTPGFRASRVLFSDWLQRSPAAGLPPGGATQIYASDRATYRDTTPGPIAHSGNPLDIALSGAGYLTVQTANGVRLTRAGHFELNSAGNLVDGQGDALLNAAGAPLQVAATDGEVAISGDGTVSTANGQIGKIAVVVPNDPETLTSEGAQLFVANGPTTPAPAPRVVQGAIEESNVQPTTELSRMTDDLREFQFMSQFIQAESDRQQSAIDRLTKVD